MKPVSKFYFLPFVTAVLGLFVGREPSTVRQALAAILECFGLGLVLVSSVAILRRLWTLKIEASVWPHTVLLLLGIATFTLNAFAGLAFALAVAWTLRGESLLGCSADKTPEDQAEGS